MSFGLWETESSIVRSEPIWALKDIFCSLGPSSEAVRYRLLSSKMRSDA
jgi:hypothetical protein